MDLDCIVYDTELLKLLSKIPILNCFHSTYFLSQKTSLLQLNFSTAKLKLQSPQVPFLFIYYHINSYLGYILTFTKVIAVYLG
jgi:hypothetical protein